MEIRETPGSSWWIWMLCRSLIFWCSFERILCTVKREVGCLWVWRWLLSICHFVSMSFHLCDEKEVWYDAADQFWHLALDPVLSRIEKDFTHRPHLTHIFAIIDRVRLDLMKTTSAIQPVTLPLIHLVPFFSGISCSAGQCVQIGPEQRSAPGLQLGAI